MSAVPPAGDLLAALVQADSVTPDAARALDVLERALAPAGFSVARPVFAAEGSVAVENMFAAIGSGPRHLTLAGHVDVVPPGPEHLWRHPPFAARVEDGVLYGRGAVDMKGGLAAMVAAALRFIARRGGDFGGRLSFVIAGDEEGVAINGTAPLLAWAAERGEAFSGAIVGEPTSAATLGDQIKIGRRGSYSATIVVEGRQGHAAYPELADNPVRGLTQLLYALQSAPLDAGTEHFGPSSLEVVSVDVGNPAWNVIPAEARARFNSRYNDAWTRASLQAEIERRLAAGAADTALGRSAPMRWRLVPEPSSSDVFLTRDEALIALVSRAIASRTGTEPRLSTSGGTSDARFIKDYCPVVEFGPVGSTMHQVDERVPLAEIEAASAIYEAILDGYFPGMSDGATLRDNLAGAIDVMRGRAAGLERMDLSVPGFWRSFGAVLFVMPLTLIGLVGGDGTVAANGTPLALTEGRVVAEIIGALVNFAVFPLVFALLAGPLGLGPRYVPFIVARNWGGGLIALAFTPIHALAAAGAIPVAAMSYVSLATLVVEMRLLYVIARTALGTPMLMTLPVIVLDFLLSLVVWSVFDRLGGA